MNRLSRRERAAVQLDVAGTLVALIEEGREADLEPLEWTLTLGASVRGVMDWPGLTTSKRMDAFDRWCQLACATVNYPVERLRDDRLRYSAWGMRGDVRVELEVTV